MTEFAEKRHYFGMAFQKVYKGALTFLAFLVFICTPIRGQISPGNAVTLKGTDYVRTTTWSDTLFNNESFTFELWFNADGPGVLVNEADTASAAAWDIAFAEITTGGIIRAGVPNVPTLTVGTVAFGTWHHLAITYNQTNQTFAAYLDGTAAGNSTGNRQSPADIGRTSVYCLGRGGPKNLGPGPFFSGKFDEVRIWRVALTADEIASTWNRIRTTDGVGLVALWHFDTTTGTSGSFSPDSRTGGNNPAWYVPVEQTMPLVPSSIPTVGASPTVTTLSPVVSDAAALLRGTGNPQGISMNGYFEWGATTAYGSLTSTQSLGSANSDIIFTVGLANLKPGTYHYRAVAETSTSVLRGQDQTFTIVPPSVTTQAPVVGDASVQLSGTANPHGFPLDVSFEYGPTIAYGTSTLAQNIGNGGADIIATTNLTGLKAGTYHYRIVGSFADGTVFGQDQVFTIAAPSVITRTATITNELVTLQGAANPHGYPINGYFQWGTTTAYGNTTTPQSLGSGGAEVLFSEILTNLARGEYHYRAAVVSLNETVFGGDQTLIVSGPAGLAAKVTGSDYIRTTTWSDTIFTGEDFTFELWFNATGPGELINEADTANPALWDYAFAEVFPGGIIKAGVPGVPTFTVGTVAFGTWHHLTLVYDGNAKLLSAYLDGQPAGSSAGDRNTPKEISRTSIYCFGRGGHANLGGGNWLSGLLDEIRIWRRPLSAAEIAGQFDKILANTDASLMANWHFDSFIVGQTYLSPDASGKNNHSWYVPQNVAIPLVASEAPVLPDRRPTIALVSVQNPSPNFIELIGNVNPRGTNTFVFFQFGRSNIFQNTAIQSIGGGEAVVQFRSVLMDLEVGGVYEYRLVASNSFGVTATGLGTFVKTGWAGHAYHFTPNDYIRTTAGQNTYFTNKSISIELWFYPTKTGVLASETTFPTIPTYDRSIIEILASGSVQAGLNGLTPVTVGDALFNQWNHVALRYDHLSQTMDTFLNGVKGPSRTGTRITPLERGVNGYFAFGRTATTKLGPGEYFGGDMDEIRVWAIARTDEDLTVANQNLLAGDEPGLVLNWRFGSNAAEGIADPSPRNNVGTNFGADAVVSTAPLMYNIRRVGPSQVEAQFVAAPFAQYRLESTADFQTWTSIATNAAPGSGFIRIPQIIGGDQQTKFFRIVAQ